MTCHRLPLALCQQTGDMVEADTRSCSSRPDLKHFRLPEERDEAKACLSEPSTAKLCGVKACWFSCHAGALIGSVPEEHETGSTGCLCRTAS